MTLPNEVHAGRMTLLRRSTSVTELDVETESVTIQAAPIVLPSQVETVQVSASEALAPRVEAMSEHVPVTPSSDVLVEIAGVVAETLLVTPGLLKGQGEVLVRLRPDVLEGTEVRIAVTGRELEVVFEPRTVDMSVLIEQCRPQLMEHLAARIHAFNVAVQVRPSVSGVRGVARDRDQDEDSV